MIVTLGVVRHGRASGQEPEAALLPEGAAYVANLGRRLHREGWIPAAAFSSPYVRARDTLRILLGELAADVAPVQLPELTPDHDPGPVLDALAARGLPTGRVLVVSHNPLVARLVQWLVGEPEDFLPGTFVEIAWDVSARSGEQLRRIGPEDL